MPEAGEIHLEPECRRCGRKEAKGIRYIENGSSVLFRCDSCGRTMHLGYTSDSNLKQIEDRRGRELAETNRSRFWREKDEQYRQDFERSKEELTSIPDVDKFLNSTLRPKFDDMRKETEEEDRRFASDYRHQEY